MSVDPKAFIAQLKQQQAPVTTGTGLDPKAFLASLRAQLDTQQRQRQAELEAKISPTESLARGAGQGITFGFQDEGSAALDTALQAILPQSLGGESLERLQAKGLGGTYREARDEYRRKNKEAEEANFKSYLGGNIVGGLATMPLLPGGGVARGLGGAIKSGLALGGVSGLGSSNADVTRGDVGGALLDTAKGSLIGGAAGAVGYGLSKLPGALSTAADKAKEFAVNQGRRAIQGSSDIAASSRKPLSDAAVLAAGEEGALKPLTSSVRVNEVLKEALERRGDRQADILSRIEDAGIAGPNKEAIAADLLERAQIADANSLGSAAGNRLRDLAEETLNKPTVINGQFGEGARLGFRQSEAIKRGFQKLGKHEKLDASQLADMNRELGHLFRNANRQAVVEGTSGSSDPAVQRLAGEFMSENDALSKLFEAAKFSEKAASKLLQRGSQMGLAEKTAGATALASGVASGNPVSALKGLAALGAANLVKNRLNTTGYTGGMAVSNALRSLAGGPAFQRALSTAGSGASRLSPALIEALFGEAEPDMKARAEALRKKRR